LVMLDLAESYLGAYRRSWRSLMSMGIPEGRKGDYLKGKLKKRGWVDFDQMENVRILESGRGWLKEVFPLCAWHKEVWDRRWRVLMYDFPEKAKTQRDSLRREITKLGMGQWQLSVWISPYPVGDRLKRILEQLGILRYCALYELERIIGVEDRELAHQVWKLDKRQRMLNCALKELQDGEVKSERLRMIVKEVVADPFLPRELLPIQYEATMKAIMSKFDTRSRK